MAAIGGFARAVAPDLPGYGRSERPARFDWSVPGYAAFIGRLVDQLGLERVHLVLHDFGGPWGLSWAAAHPQRVASVVLVNTGLLPDYRWHTFARIWRTPLLGELFQLMSTPAVLRRALNAQNPRPLPEAFIERISGYADWAHRQAVLRLYRATPDLGALVEPLTRALGPLRLPALVLWGEADPYLPLRYAQAQSVCFDAEVVPLPGCGHWPMVDDPAGFIARVLPFLRRQLRVGGAAPA